MAFTEPTDAGRFVQSALQAEQSGREHPFAVIWQESGEVVGSTRYLEIDPLNKSTEVGWTWYNPRFWSTAVNPEAKLLLLEHAFERRGARRVWLKTDAMNLHSRAVDTRAGVSPVPAWLADTGCT